MSVLDELFIRYPQLSSCRGDMRFACELLIRVFDGGNRLYICGNGGSAADALHIVGELVKSFARNRALDSTFINNADPELAKNLQGALPAFALVENSALATAFANDCNPDYVFAQQVYAYARNGDCVWVISTSGNSENIMHAANTARGRGAFTLGLTGADGGKLKSLCDVCICVPETAAHRAQELHMPVYHGMCLMLEEYYWGERN